MSSGENRAILATAGSRKTEEIVQSALAVDGDKPVLVTTYTNRNRSEIARRIVERRGSLPGNISVLGWFSFLISQCSKPYQRALVDDPLVIAGLNFNPRANRYVKKDDARRYFLDTKQRIYRDYVSDFVVRLNEATEGAVVRRLEAVYSDIFIDEVQDLAGYDLDVLDLLLASSCRLTMVGDPRQCILETNVGPRNKKYRGYGLVDWFGTRSQVCELVERNENYRCNQEICDLADSIFPSLPPATSVGVPVTGHDGVHFVLRSEVVRYLEDHPECAVLRRNRRSDTMGLPALNFGLSKGATFDRVLIFPTTSMRRFLRSRDLRDLREPEKLYVAITRARYSVAFVVD